LKKVIVFLLLAALFLSLTGCSKKSSQEDKTPLNQIQLTALKYDKINVEYTAIKSLSVYGDEIVFSAGTGKLVPDAPNSANIKHFLVYSTKSGKIDYQLGIDEGPQQIDKVEIDENWIVYSEIEDPSGFPIKIYAINGNTKERKLIFPTGEDKNYMSVYGIFLQRNYLYIGMEIENFSKDSSSGKSVPTSGTAKIVRKDLNAGIDKIIFSKTWEGMDNNYWISNMTMNESSLVFVGQDSTVSSLYIYSLDSGEMKNLLLPENSFGFILASDNYLLYHKDNGTEIAPLVIAPLSNIENVTYLPTDTYRDYTVASTNYIVCSGDDGSIFVFNRADNMSTIITDINSAEIFLNGDVLYFINRTTSENGIDEIVYFDLKENNL
jgi:hypothetical protein